MEETPITPVGLARLQAELERLTTVGRDEIGERLREALGAETNGADTPGYRDVCEDQALLELRIGLLERRIASARIVEPGDANGVIDLGERVRLRDVDSGERLRFELVGPFEADPFEDRVSIASPIGRALLGLRRGEVAIVDTPRGRRRLKVLTVDESRSLDVA